MIKVRTLEESRRDRVTRKSSTRESSRRVVSESEPRPLVSRSERIAPTAIASPERQPLFGRLSNRRNIERQTIGSTTQLRRQQELPAEYRYPLDDLRAHSKGMGFGLSRYRNMSIGEIERHAETATRRGLMQRADQRGFLGHQDAGPLIFTGLAKIAKRKTSMEAAIEEYNRIYPNRRGAQVMQRNLDEIARKYPKLLEAQYQNQRITPGVLTQILGGRNQRQIMEYWNNTNNQKKIRNMTVREGVAELVAGGIGLALGSLIIKLPVPIRVQEIPVPDQTFYGNAQGPTQAIRSIHGRVGQNVFNRGTLNTGTQRASTQLYRAISYETQIAANNGVLRSWLSKFIGQNRQGRLEGMMQEWATAVENGDVAKAERLSGQIDASIGRAKRNSERNVGRNNLGQNTGRNVISYQRLDEADRLKSAIEADFEKRIYGVHGGFLRYYNASNIARNMRLNRNFRDLARKIDSYDSPFVRQGSKLKLIQEITQDPRYMTMFNAYRFGTLANWETHNLFPGGTEASGVTGGAWLGRLNTRNRSKSEYLEILRNHNVNGVNVISKAAELLNRSMGYRPGTITAAHLITAMESNGRWNQNFFGANSGRGTRMLGNNFRAYGSGFTSRLLINGDVINFHWSDKCGNLQANASELNTIHNMPIDRFLTLYFGIGIGSSGGPSGSGASPRSVMGGNGPGSVMGGVVGG